ncbi:MAG: hypothetical protein ACLP4V_06470 [Methylocella sp.]
MRIPEIIEKVPLGTFIKFSDGQPQPTARFTKKLAAWTHNNGIGQLIEKRPNHLVGKYHSLAQFTLRMGSNLSHGVGNIRLYRVFSDCNQLEFLIDTLPEPGSVLILRHCVQTLSDELLHLSANRADAELWLTNNPHRDAVLQDVAPYS